jgi:hypothetical protein
MCCLLSLKGSSTRFFVLGFLHGYNLYGTQISRQKLFRFFVFAKILRQVHESAESEAALMQHQHCLRCRYVNMSSVRNRARSVTKLRQTFSTVSAGADAYQTCQRRPCCQVSVEWDNNKNFLTNTTAASTLLVTAITLNKLSEMVLNWHQCCQRR